METLNSGSLIWAMNNFFGGLKNNYLKITNYINSMNGNGLKTKGMKKEISKERPLISIITPVLNNAEYLEQTIQSVIDQDYDNIEYIIIDGGSTDGTLDIIKKYNDKINFWISEPDKGIYDAQNKGVSRATGKYFAVLNSGDFYAENDVVSKVASKIKNQLNVDYIYSNNIS